MKKETAEQRADRLANKTFSFIKKTQNPNDFGYIILPSGMRQAFYKQVEGWKQQKDLTVEEIKQYIIGKAI